MKEMKLGIVGLDTSHAPAFCKLLNDPANEFNVPGAKGLGITNCAFSGTSPAKAPCAASSGYASSRIARTSSGIG